MSDNFRNNLVYCGGMLAILIVGRQINMPLAVIILLTLITKEKVFW
jgi:hypothetical protein